MQLETSVFIPIKMFLFSEANCDSRGKCQVFVIHVQGSGLLMKRRRGLDAHRGQHPPGWVLSGHSTEAESRSGNSSWWKTLLPPKKVFCCHLVASVVSDCATLWAVARQAPLSVGFSRQEHWSGLPWLPPGDLSDPGIKPVSFMSAALAGRFFPTSAAWEAPYIHLSFGSQAVSSSLRPHGLQHTRLPSPSLSLWVCSNSCPLSQWWHPTISSSVVPFSSCPQSFPASGSLPLSQLFTLGGQSIGASASVLPMNIQVWFPLGLSDLIALLSKGLASPAP